MPSETDRRRVLFVATHPVQYAAPLFRRMALDSRLEIKVAFLSLAGATPAYDAGFGTTVQWDTPLLDGYPWVGLPKDAGPALRQLLRESNWDAVVLFTGYRKRAFWSVVWAARRLGVPVLFGTDATNHETQSGHRLTPFLKRLVLPIIFRMADVAIVPSSGSRDYLLGMGLDPNRVVITPYVVDNEWWRQAAASADRGSTRREWGIPADATVVLFCAKLQPWKRPGELLAVFAQLQATDAYLVFAGDGPLKTRLEAEARGRGVDHRVRFLGFVNQSRLPEVYRAADVLVLPSSYEPFGVVVNEAMLCGCTVVVSDRVGAGRDLVDQGRTGFVYPAGDLAALLSILSLLATDRTRRQRMQLAAQRRITSWSPEVNIDALVVAADRARALRSRRPGLRVGR